MKCPHCGGVIPAELGYEDLTAGATKLNLGPLPNEFLIRTPRQKLLRVRVAYMRQDLESMEDCFLVTVAPAADLTGDVARGLKGENVVYPGVPVSIKSSALTRTAAGRPALSLTGVLASTVQNAIEQAEALAFSTEHLVSTFGKPKEA